MWRITLVSDWGCGKASRIDGQRNDGDRMSDNRSAGKTWPLDTVLHLLHELGHGVSEAGGEVRMGVSYSIYKLKNYSEVYTTYIREGEPRTV